MDHVVAAIQTVAVQLPDNGELILRIFLAGVLGGLIGIEREVSDHPAGLRTHMSVAMGAALFGVISSYGFQEFVTMRADSSYQVDVTRVASQIVVGVGFLGGGAILKEGASVRGLTTAASLWMCAAIGLGVSLGMYFVTIGTTIVALAALVLLRRPQRWLRNRYAVSHESVVVRLAPGADPAPVLAAITAMDFVKVRALNVKDREDALIVNAELRAYPGSHVSKAVNALQGIDGVLNVDTSN